MVEQKNNIYIGIELGSTRIKTVAIDDNNRVLASGSFVWENKLIDGIWTYGMDEVKAGLKASYNALKRDYKEKTGNSLNSPSAIGISAMMHGYIALDEDDNLLVPFRTWRNTITEEAASKLSDLFDFNIPQRWTIAHLFQAMLKGEEHLKRVKKVFTLSSYVHYLLTGENVIGIGDASGMFPIDSSTYDWNKEYSTLFEKISKDMGYDFSLSSLFPRVLRAGENGGYLTKEGSRILSDEDTEVGIPFAPPEGDAGTGMVATNRVRVGGGNVSAGTSDFAMVVLSHMPRRHRELDMVTTPSGLPVAMVHCNNCTSDINFYISLFREFSCLIGSDIKDDEIFSLLYSSALNAEGKAGDYVSCNYYSGEGVTDFQRGIPLFLHSPSAPPSLSSFMRCHIYSALATLSLGLEVLRKENIEIKSLLGHGGYFKSESGIRTLSAAASTPVSVMETAGEGGAYGMAVLASFLINKGEMSLEDYLDQKVFSDAVIKTYMASDKEREDYAYFLSQYKKILSVERKTLEVF